MSERKVLNVSIFALVRQFFKWWQSCLSKFLVSMCHGGGPPTFVNCGLKSRWWNCLHIVIWLSIMEEEADLEEQAFHNTVREYIIFLLLFGVLYLSSYLVLRTYLHKEKQDDDSDNGEATVHRISLGMCTFALTVAVGAALLLPISILSNEVLLLYPSSYYVKWLNSSLISGLWNHVFLFSNVSIFILLPFAYFFSESEGIGQQGLIGRVYEAFVVQLLLAIIVLGMAFILCALIDKSQSAMELFFNVWNYLPFLYSCVSFLGVVLLLLCTPLGFARLFTVLGKIKSNFLYDVNGEYYAVYLEKSCTRQRLEKKWPHKQLNPQDQHLEDEAKKLPDLEQRLRLLNRQLHSSPILRRLVYPLAMILLLALTTTALLNVLQNTLQLLVGIKALPLSTREHYPLGLSSLSKLGVIGALIEVALICYLMAASTVGLYTLPFLSGLRPQVKNTPLTQLIVNCALVLVLSSALPLLSRILGISNFDLLGNYGRIEWLGNFYLVLLYNLVFAVAATLCLAKKVMLLDVWRWLKLAFTTSLQRSDQHRMLSPISKRMTHWIEFSIFAKKKKLHCRHFQNAILICRYLESCVAFLSRWPNTI